MELVRPEHSRSAFFLFYSSCLFLLSASISYYMNDEYTTLLYFLLFLTSINYWRKPEYGIRWDIDMFICKICGLYLIINACLVQREFGRYMSLSILTCMVFFYMMTCVLAYFGSVKWVLFHMAMHIYCAVCVIFMLVQWIHPIRRYRRSIRS